MAVCLGLVVVYYAWREHALSNANVASTCTVIDTTIAYNDEDSRNAYAAEITIEHEVAGKRYERADRGPTSSDRNQAESDRRDFPRGKRLSCYYVRGRPDLVTVFPGKESGALGLGLFGVFVMLVVPALVQVTAWLKRRMRWSR